MKKIETKSKFRKLYFTAAFVLLFGVLFVWYLGGMNQLIFHLADLKQSIFHTESNNQINDAQVAVGDATIATDYVEMALSADDLYPVDTNRVSQSIRDEEIRIIKNAHFENLIIAQNPPQDEDARIALIQFTKGRLTDVIINQKINIAIGQCYENPNTGDNYRCVSCMILLYNRQTNRWQEAPNGENFLKTAYDFYQPADGSDWEATDLSMKIPFDYKLFGKYKARE